MWQDHDTLFKNDTFMTHLPKMISSGCTLDLGLQTNSSPTLRLALMVTQAAAIFKMPWPHIFHTNFFDCDSPLIYFKPVGSQHGMYQDNDKRDGKWCLNLGHPIFNAEINRTKPAVMRTLASVQYEVTCYASVFVDK